jgi:hypothetical protein
MREHAAQTLKSERRAARCTPTSPLEGFAMTGVPKVRIFRRQFVVDRQWQLSLSFGAAAVVLGSGALALLATYALTSESNIESMTGREIGVLALLINGVYFGLVAAGAAIAIVLVTHSVSGPARVLEQAVDCLSRGKFDCRLTLRKRDYLKRLAESLQRLADRLKQREAELGRLDQALLEALDRGDVGAARDLVEELRGARLSEVSDERQLAGATARE